MTKTTPAWIIDRLITDGDLTPDRHTHKPRTRRCPTCNATTTAAIRASSSEVIHCDPYPTTSEGELTALMNGRRTFLISDFYGIELRFDFDILYLTADKSGEVHAEHRCHTPSLPAHPEYHPPHKTSQVDENDNIPF